jgi:5-methylcytosine-specific restriction endonuclease McrA
VSVSPRRKRTRSSMDPQLNTQARRRACAMVRDTQSHCWLCGYPINLNLNAQTHPLGSTVDEIIPRSHGGSTTDQANLGHAHRVCNTSRGNRPVTQAIVHRCRALVQQELTGTSASRHW